jgi:hypothetical protein
MAKRIGAKTIEIEAPAGANLTTRCDHEPDYRSTRCLSPFYHDLRSTPAHRIISRRFAETSRRSEADIDLCVTSPGSEFPRG